MTKPDTVWQSLTKSENVRQSLWMSDNICKCPTKSEKVQQSLSKSDKVKSYKVGSFIVIFQLMSSTQLQILGLKIVTQGHQARKCFKSFFSFFAGGAGIGSGHVCSIGYWPQGGRGEDLNTRPWKFVGTHDISWYVQTILFNDQLKWSMFWNSILESENWPVL